MKIAFDSTQFELAPWQSAFQQIDSGVELQDAKAYVDEDIDNLLVWKPVRSDWREAKNLKRVIFLGAGVDVLQTGLELPDGVKQHRLIDAGMRTAMCDYAHYAVLHYQRRFDRFLQAQRKQQWVSKRDYHTKAQSPVGVLGLGHLGGAIANYLSKQGYPVCGWSRSQKAIYGVKCYAGEEQLPKFLAQSPLLINMLPHTALSTHFLNRERLLKLPPRSAVISLSRGAVIDTDAMLSLINDGHLRGAFMDVFEREPLPVDSPLWQHPKVIITPHQSAPTQELDAVEEIMRILQG